MTIQPSRAWMRGLIGSATVVALAVPGAAFAQTLRHHDPAHDVQQASGAKTTDAPDNTTTDIVRLTLAHTGTKVSAKMKLRDYRGGTWFYVENVKTATARYQVQGTHTAGKTTFTFTRGPKTLACDGLTHSVDKTLDTIAVTVPASCLEDPRWVKVGVGYVRQGSGGAFFADDALRKADIRNNLTLSKRLKK
jgi:hypothetical protein